VVLHSRVRCQWICILLSIHVRGLLVSVCRACACVCMLEPVVPTLWNKSGGGVCVWTRVYTYVGAGAGAGGLVKATGPPP
jgi:hypothetical protein